MPIDMPGDPPRRTRLPKDDPVDFSGPPPEDLEPPEWSSPYEVPEAFFPADEDDLRDPLMEPLVLGSAGRLLGAADVAREDTGPALVETAEPLGELAIEETSADEAPTSDVKGRDDSDASDDPVRAAPIPDAVEVPQDESTADETAQDEETAAKRTEADDSEETTELEPGAPPRTRAADLPARDAPSESGKWTEEFRDEERREEAAQDTPAVRVEQKPERNLPIPIDVPAEREVLLQGVTRKSLINEIVYQVGQLFGPSDTLETTGFDFFVVLVKARLDPHWVTVRLIKLSATGLAASAGMPCSHLIGEFAGGLAREHLLPEDWKVATVRTAQLTDIGLDARDGHVDSPISRAFIVEEAQATGATLTAPKTDPTRSRPNRSGPSDDRRP